MAPRPSPALIAILGQLAEAAAKRNAGELADATGVARSTVGIVLRRAAKAGLVEARDARWVATASGRALLASAAGAKPPRRDLRQRLWTAMRRLKKASVDDLLTVAASGEEGAARDNARKYLLALGRAGYLRALPRRGRTTTWLLVEDSGARAPVVGRDGTVSDPNTGRVDHACA